MAKDSKALMQRLNDIEEELVMIAHEVGPKDFRERAREIYGIAHGLCPNCGADSDESCCEEVKGMMNSRERGTHMSHCYQGEYEGSCKYGDRDCPAYRPPNICPTCGADQEAWRVNFGDEPCCKGEK